jgi:hypothetical protein
MELGKTQMIFFYLNIALSVFLYLILREDHTAGLQVTEIKCSDIMTRVVKYETMEVENRNGQERVKLVGDVTDFLT